MEDNNSNVQEDSIADVNLADPNLDIGTTANTDDTASQGTNDAADGQNDKSADGTGTTDSEANATKADKDADGSKDASEATDATDSQQQPPDEQQDSKEYQQQRAREAWQERQQRRQQSQQIAEQLDQTYGPKSADELVQEGLNPEQAQIEALRQELGYKEERTRIAELNAGMTAEAVQVQADFPIFRELNPDGTKNPDYDPEFTGMVQEAYMKASRLQTVKVPGQNGQEREIVTNADEPLYDFYQRMANIYNRGTSRGATQRQMDQQAMLARTENPGGSSSTNRPASGSLEEMEERFGDMVIT